MCFLLFDVFNRCSTSVKEINRLIWKQKSNTYYWENLKTWHSQNFDFLGKKIWRNALTLKSKKVQDISGGTFILALSSSAVFHLQNSVSDFF